MGPRNVSIPRDVYEDDANIYSHLHLRSVHMSLFLQRVDVQRRLSFTVLCAGCDCVASSDGELLPMPGLSICFLVVTLLLSSFFPRPCVFRTYHPSLFDVCPAPHPPTYLLSLFLPFPPGGNRDFAPFPLFSPPLRMKHCVAIFAWVCLAPCGRPGPGPGPSQDSGLRLCDMPDGGGAAAFGGRPASPGYRRPRLNQSS